MRHLTKAPKPEVLEANEEIWTNEFLADPENGTKRYRYRHSEIKRALKAECSDKCVYCESKLGHNTPGDVEHMQPTMHFPQLHFAWGNLALACTECNRRKGAYAGPEPFLDPYVDNPADFLEHHGPLVLPKPGQPRAEVLVRILELWSVARLALVTRKAEKLWETQQILERQTHLPDGLLKSLVQRQVLDMASTSAEFSAMVQSFLASRHALQT